MLKLNLSTKDARIAKIDSDIEHLNKVRKIVDITFGSICGVLLFVAVVICPIMVNM